MHIYCIPTAHCLLVIAAVAIKLGRMGKSTSYRSVAELDGPVAIVVDVPVIAAALAAYTRSRHGSKHSLGTDLRDG